MEQRTQNAIGAACHSKKCAGSVAALIGVVGGLALFVGITVWYFGTAAQPASPVPRVDGNAQTGGAGPAGPNHPLMNPAVLD